MSRQMERAENMARILGVTSNLVLLDTGDLQEQNLLAPLTITDSGSGMSREVAKRIFEPFFSTRTERGGTGLGLSIVKQIVEMHKGKIWMKSSGIPGEGSTFSFTLPVYEKNEA